MAERVMGGTPAASGEGTLAPISVAADAVSRAPPAVSAALRSQSQPLESRTRAFMERRFGYDFGSVRVHADREAARSAEGISADAYTIGNRLVFGAGHYAPHSDSGRRLIAHELAHVVQQAGGTASSAPRNTIQRYGHKDSCPQSFLESHIWPGDALAKKMLPHALNSLCAALYGNTSSVRNRKAQAMVALIFGKDWKTKAQDIYDNLWKLRSALDGGDYIFDCIKGCDQEGKGGAKETEYGKTWVRTWATGGPGGTIKICYENFDGMTVEWFATVLVHEMGHLMLGLGHGKDDVSGTCAGETNDTECYSELVQSFWDHVTPQYTTQIGDLCLGGGSANTRDPSNWD
jgi:hypothetical protein